MSIRFLAIAAVGIMVAGSACAAVGTADQAFVTQAAQGGMAEVALGQMATEHGMSEEVKSFGTQMVGDHGKANDELKAMAEKNGATVPTAPSEKQQASAAKLEKMTGQSFDAAYAKMMVKDHQDTVALFRKESMSGENADLKAFAAKTLPTLEGHLKMAQALSKK